MTPGNRASPGVTGLGEVGVRFRHDLAQLGHGLRHLGGVMPGVSEIGRVAWEGQGRRGRLRCR